MAHLRGAALLFCLGACSAGIGGLDAGAGGGSSGGGGGAAGGSAGGGAAGGMAGGQAGSDAGAADAGDLSAALYEPNHVVEVQIEMAPTDWETLRNQTRDLFTLLGGDCVRQPFPSPFTTFPATVTVDGTRLPQSTVKKKGFLGSLSTTRPSLKLKFDATIPKQKVSGVDALTLNNAQQDPSVVRQCLGYALFRKAGLLAPRCNFAHVVVNGVDLGAYVNVEPIDRDYLQRHFADSSGNLYEGTLSDFTTTFVNTFDLKSAGVDRSDLSRVVTALNGPDTDLMTRLAAVMDTDQFIDFWAMETLVRHWDGYSGNTNNFFIYANPTTGRFVFIPWGADAVFLADADSPTNPVGPMLRGELPRRLFAIPSVRTRYVDRVRALLGSVFSESELRTEVTRMENLVRPVAHPIQVSQLTAGLTDVRAFIDGRRAALSQALLTLPSPPTASRAPPCMYSLGRFESTFVTRWGTLGAPNPFVTGTASFQLQLDAGVESFQYTGSTAGMDFGGNDGPRVGVDLAAASSDGGFTAAIIRIYPSLYPPASTAPQPLDLFARVGVLLRYSGGVVRPLGLVGPGTVEFSTSATTDGGHVSGRITGEVVSWPFGDGM